VLLFPSFGAGKEYSTYSFLYFLSDILDECRATSVDFSFICTDDFSFWFAEQYSRGLKSEIRNLKRLMVTSLLDEEILNIGERLFSEEYEREKIKALASVVSELSGGHIGIVLEIFYSIDATRDINDLVKFKGKVKSALAQGGVIEGLRRDLENDPIGLTKTALEFSEPAVAVEYNSPRYQYLRRSGIIRPDSPAEMVLYKGVIRELVEQLARAHVTSRVGSVATNYGIREFVESELEICDSDIVVLHISDIHVGKDHNFKFSFGARAHQDGKEELSALIQRDLKKMNILNRVDALVISGDVVCTGVDDEFRRARDMILTVMQALHLDTDRLLLIPGNHDINWNVGDFGIPASPERTVSIEGFQDLLKTLGKEPFTRCTKLQVKSRSNDRTLTLIGLDSNDVEGPVAGGIGFVSRDTLTEADKILESFHSSSSDNALWLVVHHHVLPVTSSLKNDASKKKVSVMSNSHDLITAAENWGVEAILHGHEHQPSVTWVQRWAGKRVMGSPRGLCVIGAGSCGAARDQLGPVSRNQYYVLIKRENDLLIRSRAIGEDGVDFAPHNDIAISSTFSD
jgi:predicted phosphodiesterase